VCVGGLNTTSSISPQLGFIWCKDRCGLRMLNVYEKAKEDEASYLSIPVGYSASAAFSIQVPRVSH
jgi:hypothetical protein